MQTFIFTLGVLLLLGVVIVNTWITFFITRDYTGAMFAWSFFWFVIGCVFFFGSINCKWEEL